jgi:hypothetical protein
MYAVLDERGIFGVDLDELAAHLLKEKIAGHVWSRTVTYRPMADLHPEEQQAARVHFDALGTQQAREPGEAHRRERRIIQRTGKRPLVINLISHDNGVGLTQDARLLRALFEREGHDVRYFEWRDGSGEADVNVYLELFDQKHLRTAPVHIGLFNLEWYDKHQVSSLGMMTQLWAKSQEAFRIYEHHGQGRWPVYYTGFLSRDMRVDLGEGPGKAKERICLHVRGKASQKATDIVLEAWRRHGGNLPRLIVTSAQEFDGGGAHQNHPNVTIDIGYKSEAELAHLMTRCRYHVCPSETEGWGHYIAEAISTDAAVVTVDASPMNEHIRPDFGVLLPAAPVEQGLVVRHRTDPDVLAQAVLSLMRKDDEQLDEMGKSARKHWEVRQAAFREKALALVSMV